MTSSVVTRNDRIESILHDWQERVGEDFEGYRGHVYRMFNFCLAVHAASEEEQDKLAIAASFHDIGLWSDHTVDYLPPSIQQAKTYLDEKGLEEWSEEIGLMIEWHHKIRPYRDTRFPLVEVFRKGDLVDFSLGLFRCGVPRERLRQVKDTIPNAGFHRFLMKGARDWFLGHPFIPPPFMRW